MGTEIEVIVSPNSPKPGIEGVDRWRRRLMVRVSSPPEKGKANEETCSILGEALGARVQIIRGAGSRKKTVLVPIDKKTAVDRLGGVV
ncbi:MAG: YggU family protein [Euryarchaeota archaeon]|nr:YggU family protein [Euryarchaeota archaeon]